MIGTSPARGVLNEDAPYKRPFLTSFRAYAACTRELARLGDDVVRGVTSLGTMQDKKATVRRSPDRCIVQLGPVALTLAWLCGSQDAIASGELLVIVWRGAVAPRNEHSPERPSKGPAPLGATPLWEQVLAVGGDSEETWGWYPNGDELGRCSSSELALRCVGRLHAAYLESEALATASPEAVKLT
jgi:hypothetical protein